MVQCVSSPTGREDGSEDWLSRTVGLLTRISEILNRNRLDRFGQIKLENA